MNRPVSRYTPSRRYLWLALFAIAGAVLAGWTGIRWHEAWNSVWIASALFAITAAGLLALAFRPAIEVHETHLMVGRRAIAWTDIRRLDRTGWTAPLAVYLTLANEQRLLLLYPGDYDSATSLLRHLRRYSREALLDGIPYRQFWGEAPASERKQLPAARVPLLRPEDEEEVERLFQRLKSVGRLDREN